MKKICLIDGYGFIFRAFYAIKNSLTFNNMPVNAVFGFTKSLMALQEEKNVEYIAVIFDSAGKTFRNDLYNAYKANRPTIPEDLISQFPLVREVTKALNITSVELCGFEADDLIATYTKLAIQEGLAVEIISSDKDLMQLIDDEKNVYMFDALKKQKITSTEVFTKFGVKPQQIIEFQALVGDSVDNIPGIKGIGIKTAAELLNTFGSLDNIFNNVDKITKLALKDKILQGKDSAYLSLKLVTLKNDVPLTIPIANLKKQPPDATTLYKFLTSLAFNSLAVKIANKAGLSVIDIAKQHQASTPCVTPESTTEIVNNNPVLPKENVKNIDIIDSDSLTKTLATFSSNYYLPILYTLNHKTITNISLYDTKHHINYNIQITNSQAEDLFNSKNNVITLHSLLEVLKPLLENSAIKKIFFNLKPLLHAIAPYHIQFQSCEDIMLMDYIVYGPNLNKNPLGAIIAKLYLCNLAIEDITPHWLLQLYNFYNSELVLKQGKYLYEYFDKPLLFVLYAMELQGITLNSQILKELSIEFQNSLTKLEHKIFALAEPFNISSPKQIGEILFEKLKLKGTKNRLGSWKTDASALEKISSEHKIVNFILEWRQISKLKNTYSDKLPEKINPQTGTLHTTFLQASTSTGRLSSIEPNLQNIPIKSIAGKKIRQALVAKKGYKIISLDYSQIELRLLANIGQVPKLITAFKQGEDIHNKTAMEVFKVSKEEITPEHRRQAKTINFGIIYGQTPYGLANQLNISPESAKEYITAYFQQYPEIKLYMDKAIQEARTNGYVLTNFHRRCFINDINSKNHQLRLFAERAAINAKLQGTAADIIKKAMINMFNYIQSHKYDAHLLLQIHDEVVVEVQEKQAKQLAQKLQNIMEKSTNIGIPIVVDYNIANNWLEAH